MSMLAAKVFSTVFPVFFLLGLGWLFGRFKMIPGQVIFDDMGVGIDDGGRNV